jgi:hypothetical protein
MEITTLDLATEILEWWETEKKVRDCDIYGDGYKRYDPDDGDDIPIFVKMAAAVVGLEL